MMLINKFSKSYIPAMIILFAGISHLNAQTVGETDIRLDGRNVVTTAVPFLQITPDSRSGGMADVGVAISPDANATHWNASKLAFIDDDGGGSISYTPWLTSITNDIYLMYLNGYVKADELSTFGISMRYFSLGDINLRDITGGPLGTHRPYEMAFDGSYGRKLSDRFSVGLGLRFIYSNLAGNQIISGADISPGKSVAGDLSAYYFNEISIGEYAADLSYGINISNLGSKITYTDETERNFIPANLRLGSALNLKIDEFNEIMFSIDINKLLVPTRPHYYLAEDGTDSLDSENNKIIEKGRDPNVPVMMGVVQSFYDAPGGFKEELREINPAIGIEYWYNQQLALRTGYFYEHPTKGNRQYMTLGVGIKYNILALDFAYLISTVRDPNITNPLQNTMRFTIGLKFGEGGFQQQQRDS